MTLEDALSRKGAVKRIADACGITASAVCQWTRVPKKRLAVVAQVLGVTIEELQRAAPAAKASEPATITEPMITQAAA